jgi:hypothetical protein
MRSAWFGFGDDICEVRRRWPVADLGEVGGWGVGGWDSVEPWRVVPV